MAMVVQNAGGGQRPARGGSTGGTYAAAKAAQEAARAAAEAERARQARIAALRGQIAKLQAELEKIRKDLEKLRKMTIAINKAKASIAGAKANIADAQDKVILGYNSETSRKYTSEMEITAEGYMNVINGNLDTVLANISEKQTELKEKERILLMQIRALEAELSGLL